VALNLCPTADDAAASRFRSTGRRLLQPSHMRVRLTLGVAPVGPFGRRLRKDRICSLSLGFTQMIIGDYQRKITYYANVWKILDPDGLLD
jgi:hypothetical protein